MSVPYFDNDVVIVSFCGGARCTVAGEQSSQTSAHQNLQCWIGMTGINQSILSCSVAIATSLFGIHGRGKEERDSMMRKISRADSNEWNLRRIGFGGGGEEIHH